MISLTVGNGTLKPNIKYRNYLIEFLACFVPGFLFLFVTLFLSLGTALIIYYGFASEVDLIPKVFEEKLLKIGENFKYSTWIHIMVAILSYTFGFLLYRQDPKWPDYHSYLKIRNNVHGLSPWVIGRCKGLSPLEVQYPYTNLVEYLKTRGFPRINDKICWRCPDFDNTNSGIDPSDLNSGRSKSFINSLKLRLNFYFPECMDIIIRNEAHIRFSSSLWYGTTIVTKLIYFSLVIIVLDLLLVNPPISDKILLPSIQVLLFTMLLLISVSFKMRACTHKIAAIDHKGDPKTIDKFIDRIKKYHCVYDFLPNILSFSIIIILTISLINGSGDKNTLCLVLGYFLLLGIISCLLFYIKHKVEDSFHYQRVREIVFLIETATLAKIFSQDRKLDELWAEKTKPSEHNITVETSKKMPPFV